MKWIAEVQNEPLHLLASGLGTLGSLLLAFMFRFLRRRVSDLVPTPKSDHDRLKDRVAYIEGYLGIRRT